MIAVLALLIFLLTIIAKEISSDDEPDGLA